MQPTKPITDLSTHPELLYVLQSVRIVPIPKQHIAHESERGA
jgi:hypothetical protein